jgi:hypothetical protein
MPVFFYDLDKRIAAGRTFLRQRGLVPENDETSADEMKSSAAMLRYLVREPAYISSVFPDGKPCD